jgi:hypothetical protein
MFVGVMLEESNVKSAAAECLARHAAGPPAAFRWRNSSASAGSWLAVTTSTLSNLALVGHGDWGFSICCFSEKDKGVAGCSKGHRMTLADLASIGSLVTASPCCSRWSICTADATELQAHTRAHSAGRAMQAADMPIAIGRECVAGGHNQIARRRWATRTLEGPGAIISQYWLLRVSIFWMWEEFSIHLTPGWICLDSARFAGTVEVMKLQFSTAGMPLCVEAGRDRVTAPDFFKRSLPISCTRSAQQQFGCACGPGRPAIDARNAPRRTADRPIRISIARSRLRLKGRAASVLPLVSAGCL